MVQDVNPVGRLKGWGNMSGARWSSEFLSVMLWSCLMDEEISKRYGFKS